MTVDDDSTSGDKPAYAITDINRSYQADGTDFTIISADEIHFKVHRLVLMLASTVFNDMLMVPSGEEKAPTLSLSDSSIESGEAVKAFLDIVYGQSIPIPSDGRIGHLRMIQKYDCVNARRLVLYAYESMLLKSSVSPIFVFQAAAILNSTSTCALAIRNPRPLQWASPTPGKPTKDGVLQRHMETHSTFDLRAMSFEMLETIPPKYSAALLRAQLILESNPTTTKLAGRHMTEAEMERYAAEFVKLIE